MSDVESQLELLSQLAHEFAERYRRGEQPAVSEYATRFPDLADPIRELFPALVVMEELGPAEQLSQEGPSSPFCGDSVPKQLGEFRILREVGRGGMGVVYEAVQESLGRHVALKILPALRWRRAAQVERFRREARAAAQLHHTNIVPVFGIGEHGGVHYFAMQFIQGQSLERVLLEVKQLRDSPNERCLLADKVVETPQGSPRDSARLASALWTGRFCLSTLPALEEIPPSHVSAGAVRGDAPDSAATGLAAAGLAQTESAPAADTSTELREQSERQYFRSVARLGVQIAEALDYAHGQGILHRDVKPANLLLDARGTVWVTDFGLAKARDVDDLTNPGDIVGTLCYLAPERFHGVADARSDVYSLGLTLYELLTLTPAFIDSDRGRLMKQILEQDPPAPRTICPRIPGDLETIVLKAIDKEPSRRYSSAGELADDLQRFLEDRPLMARRATWIDHIQHWRRRNPVVATLTVLLAVLLFTTAIIATAAAQYFSDLAHREEQARNKAEVLAREIQDGLDRQNRAYRLLESAQDHVRQLQFPKAHADFDEAIRLCPDNPLAWSGRGLFMATAFAWDAAASDLDRAFDMHRSREASEWYTFASLRLYSGNREGYRGACMAASEHFAMPDPRSCYWIVETCSLGPDSGVDAAEVARLADIALRSDPKSQAYLSMMGRACYRAGDFTGAVHFLNELNAQDDHWTNSEGWPVLAMACFRLGRVDEARLWLEKTRRGMDEPMLGPVYNPFATHLPSRGKFNLLAVHLLYREAQQLIDPALPDHPLRWVVQGWGWARLGEPDQAHAYFTRAIEMRPDDQLLWGLRSHYLFRIGRLDKATQDLCRVIGLRTAPYFQDYCTRAIANLYLERDQEYQGDCQRMREQFNSPTNPWEAQQMALVSLLGPAAPPETDWSLCLAEQVAPADEKNPWFALTLGAAWLRSGRYEDAIKQLRQAQKGTWSEPAVQQAGEAVIETLLCLANARAGRLDEARSFFDLAARRRDRFQAEQGTGDWGPAWAQWLMCRILLREAQRLIAPEAPGFVRCDSLV